MNRRSPTALVTLLVLLVAPLPAHATSRTTTLVRSSAGSVPATVAATDGGQGTATTRIAVPRGRCAGARSFRVSGCTVATRSGPYTGSVKERSSVYEPRRRCIAQPPSYPLSRCEVGRRSGVRMALVGNSKASQWADTVGAVARQRGWRVSTYLASRCAPNARLSTQPSFSEHARACRAWGRKVQRAIVNSGTRYVVVSSGSTLFSRDKHPGKGFATWLRPLVNAGVGVVVIEATKNVTTSLARGASITGCLRKNRSDYRRCAGDRPPTRVDAVVAAARSLRSPLVRTFAMGDLQCTSRACPLVAGRVLVYYDAHHVTPVYARTTQPWFRGRLVSAVHRIKAAR